MRNIVWSTVRSTIGNSEGESALPIWFSQLRHARLPQKSSTHRNPPFRRYARRLAASVSLKYDPPGSLIMRNGHRKSDGSVSRTITG